MFCLLLILLTIDAVIAEPEFKPGSELDLTIDLNEMTRPNFTGVWVLNHSASDDHKEALNKMKKGNNGPPGGSKGAGRDSGRMGGGADLKTVDLEIWLIQPMNQSLVNAQLQSIEQWHPQEIATHQPLQVCD